MYWCVLISIQQVSLSIIHVPLYKNWYSREGKNNSKCQFSILKLHQRRYVVIQWSDKNVFSFAKKTECGSLGVFCWVDCSFLTNFIRQNTFKQRCWWWWDPLSPFGFRAGTREVTLWFRFFLYWQIWCRIVIESDVYLCPAVSLTPLMYIHLPITADL